MPAVRCNGAPAGNATGSAVALERTVHSVLAAASSRCTSCRTASAADGGAGCDEGAAAAADSIRLAPLARRASSACPGTADANNGALGASGVAGGIRGGVVVSAGGRPTAPRVASNAAAVPTGAEAAVGCVAEGAGAEARGDVGSAVGVMGALAEGNEASSVAAEGMAVVDGAAPPDSFSRRSTAARTSCGTRAALWVSGQTEGGVLWLQELRRGAAVAP